MVALALSASCQEQPVGDYIPPVIDITLPTELKLTFNIFTWTLATNQLVS